MTKPPRRGAAAAALAAAAGLWGLGPVVTRSLVQTAPPLDVLSLRYGAAAVVFAVVLVRARVDRWPAGDLARGALVGVVGVVGYNVPIAYGLRDVPAATAGLLNASGPVWIALLGLALAKERIPRPVAGGIALAALGVALLVGVPDAGAGDRSLFVTGSLLVVLGALLWAVYVVTVRPLVHAHGAVPATALTMALGAIPIVLVSGRGAGRALQSLDDAQRVGLVVLVLGGTVLATVLWNWGVVRMGVARAGTFIYLAPLVSVAGGILLLGESPGAATAAGGALIVAGVALAQHRGRGGRGPLR